MLPSTNPRLEDIQKKILEIFKAISKICENNDLRYYAIGGTCLGAVRHKGFIPWDDDLDIAMPLQDFLKFKKIAETQLPSHLKIMDCNQAIHFNSIFMKVHDETTAFIEDFFMQYRDCYFGIYVDIMPLTGIPEEGPNLQRFLHVKKMYGRLNNLRRFPLSERKTIKSKLIWLLFSPLRIVFPFNYFTQKWYDFIASFDFDTSNYTGYVWSENLPKLIFDKKAFEDYVYLDFEDTKIRCPQGWDEYLTIQFGDYMQLPTQEEQVCKHPAIIDLHQSYREYK